MILPPNDHHLHQYVMQKWYSRDQTETTVRTSFVLDGLLQRNPEFIGQSSKSRKTNRNVLGYAPSHRCNEIFTYTIN